jgi:hypothetical protein
VQYSFSLRIPLPEIYIEIEQSSNDNRIVESDCNLKRRFPIRSGQFQICSWPCGHYSEYLFVAVLNSEVYESLSRFVIDLVDVGVFLLQELCEFIRLSPLGEFEECWQFAHS